MNQILTHNADVTKWVKDCGNDKQIPNCLSLNRKCSLENRQFFSLLKLQSFSVMWCVCILLCECVAHIVNAEHVLWDVSLIFCCFVYINAYVSLSCSLLKSNSWRSFLNLCVLPLCQRQKCKKVFRLHLSYMPNTRTSGCQAHVLCK